MNQTRQLIMIGSIAMLISIIFVTASLVAEFKHKKDIAPVAAKRSLKNIDRNKQSTVTMAPTRASTMAPTRASTMAPTPAPTPAPTQAPAMVLKSSDGYYLILENNSPIYTTLDASQATPVRLNPVKIGKFTYLAIMTADGSKYICNSDTPGVNGWRQIVYRDQLSYGSDSVQAASLVTTSSDGLYPIASILSDFPQTMFDQSTTNMLIREKPTEIFFYQPPSTISQTSLINYGVYSWTPVSL